MTNRGECRQVRKVQENLEQITMTKTRQAGGGLITSAEDNQ